MKPIKSTKSLCPECLQVIDALVYEENNCVYISKSCPQHGDYVDIYWSDYELYRRSEKWNIVGSGVLNFQRKREKGCPYDCGLCENHKTCTVLGIIDVTNRCNLNCPICFAHAGAVGYLYEPSKDQIRHMLRNLRELKPIPPTALQYSGGEPTVRRDLPELVAMAKEEGFRHVEVNSNGILLAKDLGFYKSLLDAGMSTIYLQFDGLTDDIYIKTRGVPLLDVKMRVIENAKKLKHDSIVLVVTLVRGINDHQIGDIIRFAAKNCDVVRGINVQPVSITGRINRAERERMRITIPDFMKLCEEQTNGAIKISDFRPVPWPVALARAVGLLKGKGYPEFTAHPHCGVATFFLVEGNDIVPVTRYADVDKLEEDFWEVYKLASSGKKFKAYLKLIRASGRVRGKLRRCLLSVLIRGSYSALGELMRRMVLLGCMHFMDPYNFDLERVERCCIHYALPDGTIRPFCSYNSIHRQTVERALSIPYPIKVESRAV
ncbi:MAG: radical SAM protein [Candidatus Nezhaarchaeales archaeon]